MKRRFEGTEEDKVAYMEMENAIIAAIFQIGLNQSSPKSLISLMPETPDLTREHIKSHLQKYRIQSERTNEQFIDFFEKHLRGEFYQFLSDYEKHNQINISDHSGVNISSQSNGNGENNDWRNNFETEPLLVVATESVPGNENYNYLSVNSPKSQPSLIDHQNNSKDFEFDNTSIDTSGVDVSRSDESVSSGGNYQNGEISQNIRLKAEFESVYKESIGYKNALNEIGSKII